MSDTQDTKLTLEEIEALQLDNKTAILVASHVLHWDVDIKSPPSCWWSYPRFILDNQWQSFSMSPLQLDDNDIGSVLDIVITTVIMVLYIRIFII
jgi:hypothetical protein